MNDFSDLEAELKAIRPAAPSTEMMTRIQQSLAEQPTAEPTQAARVPLADTCRVYVDRLRTRWVHAFTQSPQRTNWLALGAAASALAALVMLARVGLNDSARKQQSVVAMTPAPSYQANNPSGLVPDGLTRVVYDTRNEGLLFPAANDAPVRRVRSHSRETLQWRDARNGASLRVSYPTEEVDLIPVSGQ